MSAKFRDLERERERVSQTSDGQSFRGAGWKSGVLLGTLRVWRRGERWRQLCYMAKLEPERIKKENDLIPKRWNIC